MFASRDNKKSFDFADNSDFCLFVYKHSSSRSLSRDRHDDREKESLVDKTWCDGVMSIQTV